MHPFAYFQRELMIQERKDAADEPFSCLCSEDQDGNHDVAWFLGGTCGWCGTET